MFLSYYFILAVSIFATSIVNSDFVCGSANNLGQNDHENLLVDFISMRCVRLFTYCVALLISVALQN